MKNPSASITILKSSQVWSQLINKCGKRDKNINTFFNVIYLQFLLVRLKEHSGSYTLGGGIMNFFAAPDHSRTNTAGMDEVAADYIQVLVTH